ncbi:MAG TPA: phage holin family protein [Gemmatimonadales bacterium]|nr:phage holin family protein [Gemmatimonadales bacterium]
MKHLLLRWLVNALALWIAVALLPGLHFDQGIEQLLIVAAIFGVVNAVLRPILTLLSCPLVVVTLGLFLLVINGVLLLLTGRISQYYGLGFHVDGLLSAILGGLIIGFVSTGATLAIGERQQPRRT